LVEPDVGSASDGTLVSLKSEHDVDTLKENKLIKFVYEPSSKLSLLFITKM
jgi:hypothetical protein